MSKCQARFHYGYMRYAMSVAILNFSSGRGKGGSDYRRAIAVARHLSSEFWYVSLRRVGLENHIEVVSLSLRRRKGFELTATKLNFSASCTVRSRFLPSFLDSSVSTTIVNFLLRPTLTIGIRCFGRPASSSSSPVRGPLSLTDQSSPISPLCLSQR